MPGMPEEAAPGACGKTAEAGGADMAGPYSPIPSLSGMRGCGSG